MKAPIVSVDILVKRNDQILLGLFAGKWSIDNKPTWGLPGREILFGETFGGAVKRNLQEELGCGTKTHRIIAVNANYALDNHYIGIGVVAEITGDPKITKPQDWQKWEWFSMDNIPDNLFPPTQNLLEYYRRQVVTMSE